MTKYQTFMKEKMIKGVQLTPLKQIFDERGKVMHMLSCESPIFSKFGDEGVHALQSPKSLENRDSQNPNNRNQ